MNQYLQATVTVLSLINPVVAASIFVHLEAGRTSSQQFSDASRSALVQQLVPKLMGLLVLAMGIQFGLTGFKSFMAS